MKRYSDPRRTDQIRVDDIFAVQSQLTALKAQQSQLFSDLARGQTRFRNLARSVWRIQEEERRRFARDLHDGLGQSITAILHQLEQTACQPDLHPDVQRRLQRALDLCARTLHETRNLARLLRPKILDDLGLSAALHWLCRSVADSAGVAIDLDYDDDDQFTNKDADTLVFRLVQEALNNVAKHAHATHVLVKVGVHDRRLHLLVADDGRGFETERVVTADGTALTTGLGSMRERVALFGGTLSIVSAPAEGTQLRATLPLDELQNEA